MAPRKCLTVKAVLEMEDAWDGKYLGVYERADVTTAIHLFPEAGISQLTVEC
jgi:hypothetical protein